MFIHFYLKEWKENSLIFFMAVLFLAALAGIRLAGKDDLTMYFSGMFLWFFLPFSALMIGSSGFYTEYKNNAWAYLFSLPIRKPFVWLIKYISQLTMVLAVYGIFLLLVLLLPGIKQVMEVFSFSGSFIHYSALSSSLLVSVTVFSLAFSLSILHDKPFIIFLAAVFIGAGAAFGVNAYSDWLYSQYFGMNKLIGLSILWPLAFAAGSLFSFSRSDFSKTPAKLWLFIKITAAGLAAAAALSTGVTLADWHFRGRDYMYNLTVRKNDAFFRTKKGTLYYDKQKDKRFRLTRQRSRITAARCSDKVLLLTYDYHSEGPVLGYTYELFLMNADGTEKEWLIQTIVPDTPFSGLRIGAFDISPNGRWAAFISEYPENENVRLWRLSLETKQKESLSLNNQRFHRVEMTGWGPDNQSILLVSEEHSQDPGQKILMKADFQTQSLTKMASFLRKPYLCAVSASQQFAAYVIKNQGEKQEALEMIELDSGERSEIFPRILVQDIRWGKTRDKLAFTFNSTQAGIFDPVSKNVKVTSSLPGLLLDSHFPSLDWIDRDRKIAARADSGRLLIVGLDWNVEQSLETPFPSFRAVYGMDRTILVYNQKDNQLWRYSLDEGNWKKVY